MQGYFDRKYSHTTVKFVIRRTILYAILTLLGRAFLPVGYQKFRRIKMAEVAYCMKCKKKQAMKDTQEVTMKNGRKALKGKCTVCGTGMYKILGK